MHASLHSAGFFGEPEPAIARDRTLGSNDIVDALAVRGKGIWFALTPESGVARRRFCDRTSRGGAVGGNSRRRKPYMASSAA